MIRLSLTTKCVSAWWSQQHLNGVFFLSKSFEYFDCSNRENTDWSTEISTHFLLFSTLRCAETATWRSRGDIYDLITISTHFLIFHPFALRNSLNQCVPIGSQNETPRLSSETTKGSQLKMKRTTRPIASSYTAEKKLHTSKTIIQHQDKHQKKNWWGPKKIVWYFFSFELKKLRVQSSWARETCRAVKKTV